jgi:Ca2+-binding RTX toxin-like protein
MGVVSKMSGSLRQGRGGVLRVTVLAVLAFAVLVIAPAAAEAQRNGNFTCRATALRVGATEVPQATANAPNNPCKDDSKSLISAAINPIVQANAVAAKTDVTPDNPATTPPLVTDSAGSEAGVAGANVLGTNVIQLIGPVSSRASVTCQRPGTPVLRGNSSVATAVINGQAIQVLNQPVVIPLVLATVYLNRTVVSGNQITQQAVFIDNTLLPDITIAEARAGFTGNPCSPLPPLCNGQEITINGSGNIEGTPGNDVISGSQGADAINGNGGDDIICSLGGDDSVSGGTGNDRIDAGAGNDDVRGDAGDDRIFGAGGDDTLNGNEGNDRLFGEDGNDTVSGGAGDDAVSGAAGNDNLSGGAGADKITGGTGNDQLFGEDNDDELSGGEDDDALDGGTGTDFCDGNSGTDTATTCETVDEIP